MAEKSNYNNILKLFGNKLLNFLIPNFKGLRFTASKYRKVFNSEKN